MKTLHFCWEYPPLGAGIGQYIAGIAAGLRSLGHFTVVVSSRSPGLPEEESLDGGVIHRVYDAAEIGQPQVVDRVLALARRYGVDLIEAADHLGEAAALLARTDRPPVLINCRYNDVIRRARYAQAWYGWQKVTIELACMREWRRLRRERESIERADLLAAPSQWMINGLEEAGLRLPRQRAVLPKPLEPLVAWRNAEAATPTLLLVGRIDIGKGVGYLRDVLTRVAARVPEVRLEIAGGDSYARCIGSLREWTERQLGAQRSRVTFLGPCAREALDAAYRRAWVVIMPSRWDTSPTVLLEAMLRAKAVVTSPYGGMPEYLGDTPGCVARPEDPAFAAAIGALLADPAHRQALGERLQRRAVAEYTPGRAARAYADFVTRALENGR